MDETTAKVYRTMILNALEHHTQEGPITIVEVFYGPRHNELGFKASDGTEIVVAISERRWS